MKKTNCIQCNAITYSDEGLCVECKLKRPIDKTSSSVQAPSSEKKSDSTSVQAPSSENKSDSTALGTLKILAVILLILGILCSIGLLAAAIVTKKIVLFSFALGFFAFSLLQWAFIQVFAEMAEDIRAIRYKS